MANRFTAIAVAAVIVLLVAFSSFFIVNERQQAIVLRFGEIVDVKKEPGIYFKAPFGFLDADTVQIIEDRLLRFDLDDIRVQVSGGKFYEVDAFVAFRIEDPRVFRQAVSGDVQLAEQRLRRCCRRTAATARARASAGWPRSHRCGTSSGRSRAERDRRSDAPGGRPGRGSPAATHHARDALGMAAAAEATAPRGDLQRGAGRDGRRRPVRG